MLYEEVLVYEKKAVLRQFLKLERAHPVRVSKESMFGVKNKVFKILNSKENLKFEGLGKLLKTVSMHGDDYFIYDSI